jgi:hypothetical protein
MNDTDTVKNIAETVAIAAAALFFLAKAWRGYLYSNLSLDLSLSRFAVANSGKDRLVVSIILKKGDRGALSLSSLKVSATPVGSSAEFGEIGAIKLPDIDRPLVLTPGESTSFGYFTEIDADENVEVQILAQGKTGRFFRTGYWKASSISLSGSYKVPA